MNVNILQTTNPYLNKIDQIQRSKQLKQSIQATTPNSNNEITKNEVKYFQKMFPANAEQIENYVTFNRNGIVAKNNINKGTIIDMKV